MKRNEAVNEIYEILCEFYECAMNGVILDEEADKLLGTKDFADSILGRLEIIGLLPPFSEKYYDQHSSITTGYKWEEE
ncbi:MAG: hypothetical protein ACTSRU_19450 [Candidatus Hodarchaeales archaeon]